MFAAIHKADPDPKLLAYQYLQMLPQIAQGTANKVWVVPTELTQALGGIGQAFTHANRTGTSAVDPAGTVAGALTDALGGRFADRANGHPADAAAAVPADGRADSLPDRIGEAAFGEPALEDPRAALEQARAEAADAVADAEGETRRQRVLPSAAGTPGI